MCKRVRSARMAGVGSGFVRTLCLITMHHPMQVGPKGSNIGFAELAQAGTPLHYGRPNRERAHAHIS